MRLGSVGVAVVSLALCSSVAVAAAQDRTDAPGFFRTKQADGRWWLVDPAGEGYSRITSEAIKAADRNHMVFGSRFAYVPPEPVVAASAK